MKSRVALILTVIVVWMLLAFSVNAQAPRVWVLHNSDPNHSTPPFDDSLKLFDADGNIVMETGGFNIAQTIGGWRMIAASPHEWVCWVAEKNQNKLHKIDTDGNRVLTINRQIYAVDVSREGTVYALKNWGNIYGDSLFAIDHSGSFIDSSDYSGVDLVVDEAHSLVWTVGNDIDLLDKDLQHQFTVDPIIYCAVSVDFASDGTAWIAERSHANVPGSKNRLLHIATDGQVLATVDMPIVPSCVRVDRTTGIVWVTGNYGLYSYDPAIPELKKIAGFRGWTLEVDRPNGLIWCATYTDVRAYSMDGILQFVNSSFARSDQKYISIGSMPVYVDIKPGSCPNPLNLTPYYHMEVVANINDSYSGTAKVKPEYPGVIKAVLPAAILGTADFNVLTIDPETVQLEGVSPLRWSTYDVSTPVDPDAELCECTTQGPDGFSDLTLKFDKTAIIHALGEVTSGDIIPLILTGELYDGTPIDGQDCVIIRGHSPADGDGGDDSDIASSRSGPDQLPTEFSLSQNYPNPFNPITEISLSLPAASDVTLEIFNIVGQRIATLAEGYVEAGNYSFTWNGSGQASGIYLYCLKAGEFVETKKMMLLK